MADMQDLNLMGRYCQKTDIGKYTARFDITSTLSVLRWELKWLAILNNFFVFNNDTLSIQYFPGPNDLSVIPHVVNVPLNGTYTINNLITYLNTYVNTDLANFYVLIPFNRVLFAAIPNTLNISFHLNNMADGGVPGNSAIIQWALPNTTYTPNQVLGGNFVDSAVILNDTTYIFPNQYNLAGFPFIYLIMPQFISTISRDILTVNVPGNTQQISNNKMYLKRKLMVPLPVNFNGVAYWEPANPLWFEIPFGWNDKTLDIEWYAPDGTPLNTDNNWAIYIRTYNASA